MSEEYGRMPFDRAYRRIKAERLQRYGQDGERSGRVTFHEIRIHGDKENMYDAAADAYVPMKYVQFADSEVVIAALADDMDFARGFYASYADDLFGTQALQCLYAHIGSDMRRFQLKPYAANDDMDKHLMIYGLGDASRQALSNVHPSTVRFQSGTGYANITGSYRELAPGRDYYGTLIGSDIVSIVGCNNEIPPAPLSAVVDIGLETHADYRRNGYAVSNVTAMSAYLTGKGHVVQYCCNNRNANSIRTAAACGFQAVANEKTVWCVNG
ncbi:hypothetical protein GXP70_03210 [Paenibacillus lycopersici]|uniref:Uncharacterized protein n=1 Tax=Paenibacillus lycopersici TaxID=2704462 RepID=A0A6C0FUR7_9BACL|nr:hypothetical protein [Paenibacillus lycopersici]QHT59064.1 hypothetical protein GXP70_03210 [Paenibacillus lycopersici]